MVTLTQLEYIVAVDTYRHFGKAAETLTGDELKAYFLDLVHSGISYSYQN